MILIKATPIRKGFASISFDNKYFINPDEIVMASFNDKIYSGGAKNVNVTLKDKTEWMISREIFESMLVTIQSKGQDND